MIWCESIDCGACSMIKSCGYPVAPVFRWLPRRFALKGKDFA
jgi:hypothetical protein